jgi:hypothetical protein
MTKRKKDVKRQTMADEILHIKQKIEPQGLERLKKPIQYGSMKKEKGAHSFWMSNSQEMLAKCSLSYLFLKLMKINYLFFYNLHIFVLPNLVETILIITNV